MRSVGDDLIGVDVADAPAAQALAAALRESGRWIEVVAGIDSVVVQYDSASESREDAATRLALVEKEVRAPLSVSTETIEIPIAYGGEYGPDLSEICKQADLTENEFIELHSGSYVVEMLGFIPGFAYVGGLDERLNVPRLPAPSQSLPAGSVGVAGGKTGLYALPGPGGWPIIGRTSRQLFDPNADDPFLLAPGTTVVFTAVDEL